AQFIDISWYQPEYFANAEPFSNSLKYLFLDLGIIKQVSHTGNYNEAYTTSFGASVINALGFHIIRRDNSGDNLPATGRAGISQKISIGDNYSKKINSIFSLMLLLEFRDVFNDKINDGINSGMELSLFDALFVRRGFNHLNLIDRNAARQTSEFVGFGAAIPYSTDGEKPYRVSLGFDSVYHSDGENMIGSSVYLHIGW
ncbi:hypothetical protein ACFLQJ_00390, partial [Calditrichota bacterium]